MITSESPATQSRSFLFGVNATLAGGFEVSGFAPASSSAVEPGFGVTVVGGTTIATSISSASPRPMASWTSPRGRSSRSAWLTCCEPAGERERDVALRARLAVERRLVHPGSHQQRAEDEGEQRRRRAHGPPSSSAGRPRCAGHAPVAAARLRSRALRGPLPRRPPACARAAAPRRRPSASSSPPARSRVVRRRTGGRALPTRGRAAASAARQLWRVGRWHQKRK